MDFLVRTCHHRAHSDLCWVFNLVVCLASARQVDDAPSNIGCGSRLPYCWRRNTSRGICGCLRAQRPTLGLECRSVLHHQGKCPHLDDASAPTLVGNQPRQSHLCREPRDQFHTVSRRVVLGLPKVDSLCEKQLYGRVPLLAAFTLHGQR